MFLLGLGLKYLNISCITVFHLTYHVYNHLHTLEICMSSFWCKVSHLNRNPNAFVHFHPPLVVLVAALFQGKPQERWSTKRVLDFGTRFTSNKNPQMTEVCDFTGFQARKQRRKSPIQPINCFVQVVSPNPREVVPSSSLTVCQTQKEMIWQNIQTWDFLRKMEVYDPW